MLCGFKKSNIKNETEDKKKCTLKRQVCDLNTQLDQAQVVCYILPNNYEN